MSSNTYAAYFIIILIVLILVLAVAWLLLRNKMKREIEESHKKIRKGRGK